ncbi:leucine-rich repeat-domain-containing protein, partial [Sporodiniella umbellata]
MKITVDLLSNVDSRINPLGDRELILRDFKIPVIENLGVTKDLNDSIDFTNNDLRSLGNFPRLNRLQSLILNNNRIHKIETELDAYIPNVNSIILTNNLISELKDIEPLKALKKLTHLSLLDNPVTKKPNYRLFVIFTLSSVRVLDFNKVKLSEKKEAQAIFGSNSEHDKKREASEVLNKTLK